MNRITSWVAKCSLSLVLTCPLVYAEEAGQAPPPPPLTRPLANAVLSPALKKVAERDGVILSSPIALSDTPAPGDAIVFWVGATRGKKAQQWLVELKRGITTPEERKIHGGKETKKYLSWGPVIVFNSDSEALDLWIAGPVSLNTTQDKVATEDALPRTRRTRIFVPADYLRLGLDNTERVSQQMTRRISEILKDDPKFGFGHIYSMGAPIKPENIAYAKPVAERIGFTPEMERAWTGGYVALEAFYALANDVPDLREIAEIAVEKPPVWKLAKLAFGTHLITNFGGPNALVIDPGTVGLLPVRLETFEVPFSYLLGNDLIVSGVMAVTAPTPPLDVGAGIIGVIARHPKDPTRAIELTAISTNRGLAEKKATP